MNIHSAAQESTINTQFNKIANLICRIPGYQFFVVVPGTFILKVWSHGMVKMFEWRDFKMKQTIPRKSKFMNY